MKLELVPETPKTIISLAEVKEWLKVDYDEDDAAITRLIHTAGTFLENALSRTIILRKWRCVFDPIPQEREIILPFSPVSGGEKPFFYEKDGMERSHEGMFNTYFRLNGSFPATLFFSEEMTRIAGSLKSFSVVISFGEKNVPEPLKQAAFLLVSWWFENRGDESSSQARNGEFPLGLERLIAPYRIRRLK